METEQEIREQERLATQAVLKDFTEWTDEEREAVEAVHRRQEAARKAQEERKAQRKAEGEARLEAYNKMLAGLERRDREKAREREANPVAYFMAQAAVQMRELPTVRLEMEGDKAREVLSAAYRQAVARSGRLMLEDETLARVTDVVARWLTDKGSDRKQGLLLSGGVGCGKTTMLKAISDAVRVMSGATVTMADAQDLVSLAKKDRKEFYDLAAAKVLAIDDLGTEPQTVKDYGNETTPMAELLADRYKRRLPTLASTNLDREGLAKMYGERVADRLAERCNMITYAAAVSFRQR